MSYGKRLQEAIELANASRVVVAHAAGVSVQAIGQVIREETTALTAENSARVAAALKVDHFWLATGEGKPRPDRAWPYEHFSSDQFFRFLTAEERKENEALLWGKIMMAEKKNGTR